MLVTIHATGTDVDVNAAYYVVIDSLATGSFWNPVTGLFDLEDAVGADFALTEVLGAPGLWRKDAVLPPNFSGRVRISPYDAQTGYLLASQVRHVYVTAGVDSIAGGAKTAYLHRDFPSAKALRLVNAAGEPIEGVVVRVFNALAYLQNNLATPLGITHTDATGRWLAPIPVPSGSNYVVLFHKVGVIGPTAVDVSIPFQDLP